MVVVVLLDEWHVTVEIDADLPAAPAEELRELIEAQLLAWAEFVEDDARVVRVTVSH